MSYKNIIPYNENVWWSRKIQNKRQKESQKKKIQENTEHLQNKLNMARKGTKYVCLILAETAEQKTDVQLICIST